MLGSFDVAQGIFLADLPSTPRQKVVAVASVLDLYSMALGTGLRLRELLSLNVGDVPPDGREVQGRVTLDPATTKGGRRGEVFVPARVISKLNHYLSWKRSIGQPLDPDAPLFVSGRG